MITTSYLYSIGIICLANKIALAMAERTDSNDQSGTSCAGCRDRDDVPDIRSQYHLQRIKEKIEAALGLDPSKNTSRLERTAPSLPSPIRHGYSAVIGESDDEDLKTQSQRHIILSEQDKRHLKYKIPLNSLVAGKALSLADIWLPVSWWKRSSHRMKMRLNHNGITLEQRTIPVDKINAASTVRDNGWVSFSVKDVVRDFVSKSFPHALDQYVIWLAIKLSKTYFSYSSNNKSADLGSFLVLETIERVKSRQRRGVDCVSGKNHRCCRGKLTVRFADIGLGDHVIEPREFEAYQCVGTCGSFSTNISPRVEIVKSVLSNLRLKQAKTDHIKFCCTAERSGSQKLIYYNTDKTQILAKNVNGLVVESCDCL